MDRPTILLAINDQADAYVTALERAGFEPFTVDPSGLDALPAVDLGVIDCDLPAEFVTRVYERLHAGTSTPTLLLVGEGAALPDGIGSSGDQVRSFSEVVGNPARYSRVRDFHCSNAFSPAGSGRAGACARRL